MSAGQFERFHFDHTKFPFASAVFATDGTTGAQVMSDTFMLTMNAPGTPFMFCEPEYIIQTLGRDELILDHFSRVIVFCGRGSGAGDWDLDIQFRRNDVASGETALPTITLPIASGSGEDGLLTFDNALPGDFMKSRGGSEALSDPFYVRMVVTPGSATVASVFAAVMLVPGFTAQQSNKGANLSAPQFLTYR